MTNQLADGKIVLVLEGGYELNALAECGKLCIEALLSREVRFLLICKLSQYVFFSVFSYLHLAKKLLKLNQIYMQYIVYNVLLKYNVCI
jgi:type III secretory pathway component EscU